MRTNVSPLTPQQITKRWLWRLGLGFLLFLAALVLAFAIWRVTLSRKIDRTLAAIQNEGYPISLAQLEQKYYPEIPREGNAAFFFQNAFAGLHTTNSGKDRIPDPPEFQSTNRSRFLSQRNLDSIAKLLADNHEALELLRQSPTATNCRYPVNLSLGLDMSLPHLYPLRDSSRLLALAAVVDAQNGDVAVSVDDLTAIFRLAHSLDREPILLSQMARMNTEMRAITSLEYVLTLQLFSDPQFVQLAAAFRDPENASALERAFAGELCTGAHTFQMFGVEPNKPVQNNDPNVVNGSSSSAGTPRFIVRLLKLTGFFYRDYCFYLGIMGDNLRIARLPPREKLEAASDLGKRMELETSNHYYLVSSVILPGLRHPYLLQIRLDVRLNLVQAVLAVERYRLAHQNRLPDKLSDLVPAFLNSVPVDPFDGKPIRYKKLAKGYLVYSVGEDGKDDGGVYAPQARPGAPADITFVVER